MVKMEVKLMANIERDEVSGTDTTGHEWDGIKELNTPLPRWWLWTFYATIVFSVVWWVLYPSWPTLTTYWKGTLEYSSRVDLANDLTARDNEPQRAARVKKIASMPIAAISEDKDLREFAAAGGRVIFADNCAPCHGSQGSGAPGYPVLADDDWLWGGSLEAIETTIRYGIRSTHDDTRVSEMPVFGTDYLSKTQIADVTEYVLSLTNKSKDSSAAMRGAEVFAGDCAACHGEKAEGGRDFGAPKLSDGIWLHGDSREAIIAQVTKPMHGVMPTWQGRLDDVAIKEVAVYVHSLGGGE